MLMARETAVDDPNSTHQTEHQSVLPLRQLRNQQWITKKEPSCKVSFHNIYLRNCHQPALGRGDRGRKVTYRNVMRCRHLQVWSKNRSGENTSLWCLEKTERDSHAAPCSISHHQLCCSLFLSANFDMSTFPASKDLILVKYDQDKLHFVPTANTTNHLQRARSANISSCSGRTVQLFCMICSSDSFT